MYPINCICVSSVCRCSVQCAFNQFYLAIVARRCVSQDPGGTFSSFLMIHNGIWWQRFWWEFMLRFLLYSHTGCTLYDVRCTYVRNCVWHTIDYSAVVVHFCATTSTPTATTTRDERPIMQRKRKPWLALDKIIIIEILVYWLFMCVG